MDESERKAIIFYSGIKKSTPRELLVEGGGEKNTNHRFSNPWGKGGKKVHRGGRNGRPNKIRDYAAAECTVGKHLELKGLSQKKRGSRCEVRLGG